MCVVIERKEKIARYLWLIFVISVSLLLTLSYDKYLGFGFYQEGSVIKYIANQLFLLPSPINLIGLVFTALYLPLMAFFAWKKRVVGGNYVLKSLNVISKINDKI